MVDLGRRGNEAVACQARGSAHHRSGELENIRVAYDARVLTAGRRRGDKHAHGHSARGDIHVLRCDDHSCMIHQSIATIELESLRWTFAKKPPSCLCCPASICTKTR